MNLPGIITHREALGYWLNEHGLTGKGAEIGCAEGRFSSTILASWKGETLYLIDPWTNLSSEEYPQKHDGINFDAWHQSCVALSKRDPRAVLVRKRSVVAVNDFENWSLDFVYIDAAHDYRNVLQDMDAWFPKVKPGGLFCGHDFEDNTIPEQFNEVIRAVTRWMHERALCFTVTRCSSWWAIK